MSTDTTVLKLQLSFPYRPLYRAVYDYETGDKNFCFKYEETYCPLYRAVYEENYLNALRLLDKLSPTISGCLRINITIDTRDTRRIIAHYIGLSTGGRYESYIFIGFPIIAHYIGLSTLEEAGVYQGLDPIIAHYIGLSTLKSDGVSLYKDRLSPTISGCLQQYLVFLFTNSTTL